MESKKKTTHNGPPTQAAQRKNQPFRLGEESAPEAIYSIVAMFGCSPGQIAII